MELPKPNPTGFMMTDMSAQPVTSSRWKNDAQRAMVREFIQNFRPEWNLPKDKFSEWHVLALDATTNPNAYYYDKPLIILQDSGTFSAGDIFLGAFESHPNTTLMGTPSGGGNGWQEGYVLPNTGLGLILCQSAKFRPNGKTYDGVGIEPDIVMETTPQDIIGDTDTVLEAALKRLQPAAREGD
jgi:carboxyl-terminal processing protease